MAGTTRPRQPRGHAKDGQLTRAQRRQQGAVDLPRERYRREALQSGLLWLPEQKERGALHTRGTGPEHWRAQRRRAPHQDLVTDMTRVHL